MEPYIKWVSYMHMAIGKSIIQLVWTHAAFIISKFYVVVHKYQFFNLLSLNKYY